MQENEFEKQVKQLMDDFKVAPSGEAWEKLSRKLDEKRRRRLPFIFLLALGLCVAGFLVFYTVEKQSPASAIITKAGNDTPENNNVVIVVDSGNMMLKKHDVVINNKYSSLNKNSVNTLHDRNVFNKKKSGLGYAATSATALNQYHENNVNDDNVVAEQLVKGPVTKENSTPPDNSNMLLLKDSGNNIFTTTDTATTANKIILTDNLPVTDSTVIAENKPVNTTGNSNKKASDKNITASKWQWGINAFYGKNNAVNALINEEKVAPSYLNSPTSIITGDTIFNEHVYTASDAYSFGFELQRKISKKISLSSGLNFIHLSTKSDVRNKVDSVYTALPSVDYTVNSYYQPGTVTGYTNKYNFIELPVYLQHDLLLHKQFSFGYNAGFSVRQLISSNSLIYSPYNNIYFSKNTLLSKTQFQVLAGLNFKFNTSKTTSVYAGPQFSYSLSNFMNNSDYGNYHFMTYGIKAGLLFHKK